MSDINFLTQRRSTLSKTEEQDLVYRKYAMWGLYAGLAFFLLTLGVNIFLTQRLRQANAQQKALTDQIASDEPVEMSFLIFSQKLKSVREIYENRSNKQQAIDFFSNLFGSQVFLSGMSYGGEGNELSLRLTSENVFALENTLDTLDSEEVTNNFSSVTKSGLRRSEAGTYSLDLAVELKREGEQ
jgi:hypothetical protein